MDLASIFTTHWQRFAAKSRHLLTAAHYKAARAVMACRTAELGGEVHYCGGCPDQKRYVYHSCNHRACPKCGGREQKEWAAAQEAKLLPRVPYFMLTFTIPEELRRYAYAHQAWFYDAMFRAASETLMDFAQDEKHLGGTPGYTAVLHTWTRQMAYHPHLHIIMPGLALSADGLRVKRVKRRGYLFPIAALAAAFRHRLDKAILARDSAERTRHHTQIDPQVWQKDWVIDAQAVGRGVTALRYLARYVHKTAISEPRLKGYDASGNVKVNCQNSDTGKWSHIHLKPDELLRRWCLHVLPKGLVRVRHYGLHSAAAKAKLARVHQILGTQPAPRPAPLETPKPKCPCCGKDMILLRVIPRLPRAWLHIPSRAPPPTAQSPPQQS